MKNILELLEQSSKMYPDKIAFNDTKKRITYSELENAADTLIRVTKEEGISKVEVNN